MIEELEKLLQLKYYKEEDVKEHYEDIKRQFYAEFLLNDGLRTITKNISTETEKIIKKKICDNIRKKYIYKKNFVFSSKRLAEDLDKIENEFWEI